MRIWHYQILPFLPEAQFKGQLRELVAILHDWRDKGKTNNLLINRIMDFSKNNFVRYFLWYEVVYHQRYNTWLTKQWNEFKAFDTENESSSDCFDNWHNKEYLRCNMANLYEKWKFGKGKSRITDDEWQRLLYGYKKITGEDYKI